MVVCVALMPLVHFSPIAIYKGYVDGSFGGLDPNQPEPVHPTSFEGKSISVCVRYGLEGNGSPQFGGSVTKTGAELRT